MDGVGFSRIGHTLDTGPEIDQASLLFMWSEAILFPAAWRERDEIFTWSELDERAAATITFERPAGPVAAQLRLDPGTGMPDRFVAERHMGVGSTPFTWTVDCADWGPTEDGVMLPRTAQVTWADEPGPWFRMEIRRADPGADVAEAIDRGRRVVADARAD